MTLKLKPGKKKERTKDANRLDQIKKKICISFDKSNAPSRIYDMNVIKRYKVSNQVTTIYKKKKKYF